MEIYKYLPPPVFKYQWRAFYASMFGGMALYMYWWWSVEIEHFTKDYGNCLPQFRVRGLTSYFYNYYNNIPQYYNRLNVF